MWAPKFIERILKKQHSKTYRIKRGLHEARLWHLHEASVLVNGIVLIYQNHAFENLEYFREYHRRPYAVINLQKCVQFSHIVIFQRSNIHFLGKVHWSQAIEAVLCTCIWNVVLQCFLSRTGQIKRKPFLLLLEGNSTLLYWCAKWGKFLKLLLKNFFFSWAPHRLYR